MFTLELPEYWENKQADQTLEVLMSDLDPAVMDQFYTKDGVSANDVTRVRRGIFVFIYIRVRIKNSFNQGLTLRFITRRFSQREFTGYYTNNNDDAGFCRQSLGGNRNKYSSTKSLMNNKAHGSLVLFISC